MHVTGPEAAVFYAHEKLLTSSSLVLVRSCRELGSASSNRRIFFENLDPRSFNLYLNWLYTSAITLSSADSTGEQRYEDHWPLLINLYVLSIRLEDLDFADAVTDAMVSYFAHTKRSDWGLQLPISNWKHFLYDNTPPKAKVRRLLVQMYAHVRDPVLLDERDPAEFLAETSQAMMKGAAEDPLMSAATCCFHEHGNSRSCYRDRL